MPEFEHPLSEELLSAYVDGELDAEAIASVEAALAKAPEAQSFVRELRKQNEGLAALFETARDQAATPSGSVEAPATLLPRLGLRERTTERLAGLTALFAPLGRARLASGLLAACGLALGLLLGQLFTSPGSGDPPSDQVVEAPAKPGWKLAVATYHALYGEEALNAYQLSQEQRLASLQATGEGLGLDLTALSDELGDSRFERAQLLRFGDRPLAQLLYQHTDESGVTVPVALCILPRKESGAPALGLKREVLLDQAVIGWSTEEFAFIVVGGVEDPSLETFASTLQRAL